MSMQHREEISRRLRPVRPPRIVDDVLDEGQLDIVLDLIRRHGPWDLILKHHFRSLEELVATTSAGRPIDPDVSLDSFLTPTFRGFFASGGVCLHPEAEPIFYERRFMAWVREFWGARYCQPAKILFNVNGPAWNADPGHLDSPRFRGLGIANTPTWLLSVMGKSGLFQPWAVKLARSHRLVPNRSRERWLHLLARRAARRTETPRTAALESRRRHPQHRDGPPRRIQRDRARSARIRAASPSTRPSPAIRPTATAGRSRPGTR
jgi:hypothetical protein